MQVRRIGEVPDATGHRCLMSAAEKGPHSARDARAGPLAPRARSTGAVLCVESGSCSARKVSATDVWLALAACRHRGAGRGAQPARTDGPHRSPARHRSWTRVVRDGGTRSNRRCMCPDSYFSSSRPTRVSREWSARSRRRLRPGGAVEGCRPRKTNAASIAPTWAPCWNWTTVSRKLLLDVEPAGELQSTVATCVVGVPRLRNRSTLGSHGFGRLTGGRSHEASKA
jgi:hypothetical protein